MANKETTGNQVTIKLTDDLIVELNTNTPNIDKLISDIVENRNTIEPDNVRVECEDEKFDCESFREIIQKAIKDLIDDITIEEAAVNRAREWISERSSDESDEETGEDAAVSPLDPPANK